MSRRSSPNPRIYLSPPHLGDAERELVAEAFDSNWIAPLGPHVDAFERELCQRVDVQHGVALSSGTAALHLALELVGVGPGDDVIVSTLTFAATAFATTYVGGQPVFVDSERTSWNIDPKLLRYAIESRVRIGEPPAAVIVVDLYGQTADFEPILEVCREYGIPVIEDAAEALGATHREQPAGSLGDVAIFSFNGNKIITTSGGGMLVSDDADLVSRARKLAMQAREPVAHYEHREIGYNYRLSNVLAGIGRGQLRVLEDRVRRRREVFDFYRGALGDLPGLEFMPEAPWGRSTRWLTCLTIDPNAFGADREAVRLALEEQNVEARPVWKPMHLQPVFEKTLCYGRAVSEDLFARGLCLPSGSTMTDADLERVADCVRAVSASTRAR